MVRFVIKLNFVLLFLLSFTVAAQPITPNVSPLAPPVLANLSIDQVVEGQAIAVSVHVAARQNRIVSVGMATRADGTGSTNFSSAGPLQRVGTTNTYQGSITSRLYGGYTLRVAARYQRLQIPPTVTPPVQQTISIEKTFIVSAGANCFAFDQAGSNEEWTGTPLRMHDTGVTFGTCVANPLHDPSNNWPFNVANSGRGGLSDRTTVVDICENSTSTEPGTAFWHAEYVSPDLTSRATFQNPTEIVVRVRSGARALTLVGWGPPQIQLQAQLAGNNNFRFPENGVGVPLFVTLEQNLDTGITSHGRLRNRFDQTTGWNVISWQPRPALTEVLTRLRVRYLDTFQNIRNALGASEITYRLPSIDGVCARH